MIDLRVPICAVASVVAHFVLGEVLSTLPPRPPPTVDHKIEIRVVEPPAKEPPKEPDKPPEPAPDPKPDPTVVHQKVTPHPAAIAVHDVIPQTTPVAEHAVVAPQGQVGPPVFGVTMESTSQGGSGPVMPVGNTTQQVGGAPASTVKPLAAPVAAYEVTKMPLPQGRCSGKYTDAARAAALEGTVVLDLIVDEHGRARDIVVVSGLANGLTEAAVAALKDCRFTPGEKDGKPVPVKVRSFKIRFVMQDAS